MPKALIVYATRTNNTKEIGELIAEGMRLAGAEADVVNIAKITKKEDLMGYDAYVFGSATYHGDMIQSMKTMLFLAEKANLEGKAAGAFGAFGWSGEAPDRIFNTMKHVLKMDVAGDSLRLKSAKLGGGLQMAQGYGREIAEKIGG